jgi:hypothetical protein
MCTYKHLQALGKHTTSLNGSVFSGTYLNIPAGGGGHLLSAGNNFSLLG